MPEITSAPVRLKRGIVPTQGVAEASQVVLTKVNTQSPLTLALLPLRAYSGMTYGVLRRPPRMMC